MPCPKQKVVQIVPYLIRKHIAEDFLVANAPALCALAPADHFNFKAIILHVNTSSEVQNIIRHLCGVDFAAVEQLDVLQLNAAFLPRLAQLCVHPDLHLFRVAMIEGNFRFDELRHDLFPANKGRSQRVQVEASGFCTGIGGNILTVFPLLFPAVFI